MPFSPAKRLRSVKPSPSMAAKAKLDALRSSGRRVVDFTIGEPDAPTPPHIAQAGVKAIVNGDTKYTGAPGVPALRAAIARKLKQEKGLTCGPEQVVVGIGAKQIIYNAFAASLNPGDEVIIPAPFWVSYPDMVALHEGTPVIVSCGEEVGFKLTPTALQKAIKPCTRWLILNSPANPTGAVYSSEELQALAAVLVQHPHVWILTDEIYEHYTYGGSKHTSIVVAEPALADRTLIVSGVSKTYAMTGWRIGYGAGPADLMKALTLIATQSISCPSSISQAAALAALEGPQSCVSETCELYECRRDFMVRRLKDMPGLACSQPQGAFYAFPSVTGLYGRTTRDGKVIQSDLDVALALLDEAGVAVMDGTSYGMPGYLRLSFATSLAELEAGCDLIKAWLTDVTATPSE